MDMMFLLLLFCHVSSAVKHSLKTFVTGSFVSGVSDLTVDVLATGEVDGVLVGYCDSNRRIAEPRQDWVKEIIKNDPQHWQWYIQECFESQPKIIKDIIPALKDLFNLTDGVHIIQQVVGCEWDEETGEVNGLLKFGFDGEDFVSLDLTTSTWTSANPQAEKAILLWNINENRAVEESYFLTEVFPEWLKKYVTYGNSSLQRRDLPSVSLLQKTPSSPVSCHTTGFYPDRATMFWRKDEEELHEDVDLGEILPNNDGSFQMSVDLKPPSEDWEKYECVFQLSGVKNDIITKLDKAKIRTNWKKASNVTVPIISAVAVLALILIAAAGFRAYKKKKAHCPPSSPENGSELSEHLNSTASTQLGQGQLTEPHVDGDHQVSWFCFYTTPQ
ncbi:major histocompatibility complex class I-related gene protein-like isoform X2 [Micropterus dolomieu]|uniref:major histocompatibility complex class I-related gene protein-like isoform X2 n=1 Tax=Micropterus dolomieu TaxID=147949 RepID=UPI001E8CD3FA|nr:major histocompatibility complex class I-related gene protein-like isoform X2 [Micropterus dolomieu]